MSAHNLVFFWPNSFNFSSYVMFYTSDHSHYYPLAYFLLIQTTSEVHCLQLDIHQGEWENYSLCLWDNTPTYHTFGFPQQLGSSIFHLAPQDNCPDMLLVTFLPTHPCLILYLWKGLLLPPNRISHLLLCIAFFFPLIISPIWRIILNAGR